MGLALLRGQRGWVNRLVLGIQALIGAQAGPEFGHAGQRRVVGGPQFRRVGHAVEMAYGPPGGSQVLGGNVQHLGNGIPAGRKFVGRDGFEGRIGLLQQHIDRRGDVVRRDAVKLGEVGEVEEGVAHAVLDGALRRGFKLRCR